jgi:methionyl-tRNA synthetase
MSKSLGNVINPFDLIDQYGIDYVRYFFISEIVFGNDGDFSHETFQEKINADLANDIGNLLMRTVSLIQKHCGGTIPTPTTPFTPEDDEVLQLSTDCLEKITSSLDQYHLKQITDAIVSISKLGNKYIVLQEPWSLAKKDDGRARMETILYVLAEILRRVGVYISPIIPTSGKALLDQLGIPESHRTFASIRESLPTGLNVATPVPVFPKLETKKAAAAAAAAVASTGKSSKSKGNK